MGQMLQVTHLAAAPGAKMPCCGLSPFDVPSWHRLSADPSQVTCPGKET
jgi:hypothetical protein